MKVRIEAQVACCGASTKLVGFEVPECPEGVVPSVDHPTQDGRIVFRPLFNLRQLPELLASGYVVEFSTRFFDVGALEFSCMCDIGARQVNEQMSAWWGDDVAV